MKTNKKRGYLVLSDGTVFEGKPLGAIGEKTGEVVFNTSMTGYQEILTDPSYKGQIITMTYPLIGNYGVNDEDTESVKIHAEGFIVKEASGIYSNFRGQKGLSQYLTENNIVGLEDIDTRALTRHIRTKGAMEAVISSVSADIAGLIKKAKGLKGFEGEDTVAKVTCNKPYTIAPDNPKYTIVAYDFGIKRNIVNHLAERGCRVIVVPASTTKEEAFSHKPHGIFLSNGPGDPAGVSYAIENIKGFIGKIPVFGICLGHQILALSLGAKTFKLKFGHHGGNHPVKDLATGKIEITAQNHGFSVDPSSITEDILITHMNLNDNTVEGLRHKKLPVFSVQYHPESAPGPHDSHYLFDRFINLLG